ncbi:cytochrome c4 [Pseudomonas sp. BN414]|uniref:c-type cytochrome n=1 Tax=Pseudomonas TaxID=286 RepID=UPI000FB7C597|nr:MULTISPECIES: c-type cytochrome [Pseudomonas]MDH4568996.1 cytochrome c4 [Pseudomonas sp. BN414]MDH4656781.1 cytochrome c4 [Pseudomonas sp. BN606]NWL76563.1 cytochrome C [Pseudomonas taiwanensis]
MKKLIAVAVVVVLAGLLAFYGRDALDLYRLMDHISTSTEAKEADGGPWPRLSDACVGCHGVQGKSQHQGYPSLAGQPATYLANQLRNFASGARANPNMGPLAMTLSEADVQQLAAYFAKQSAAQNSSFKADPVLREKGQRLALNGGCAACHGEGLMGRDQFPRLAGQGHDYLLAQLNAFAEGRRKDSTGAMTAIVSTLSADDRQALSHYLAALVPVAK